MKAALAALGVGTILALVTYLIVINFIVIDMPIGAP